MVYRILHKLVRRKQRDDAPHEKLKRELKLHQLVAIGVGTTIGAGIFVLVGTVGKQRTGPALPLSFLVAGLSAAFSALNYAELSSRLPSAGSAYHYAYTCLGEGCAWIVGWSLILEYTVAGAAVARGVSPNLVTNICKFFSSFTGILFQALFFGKALPFWLERHQIPLTNILVDPFAGFLVVLTTVVLCTGIKRSAGTQLVLTSMLVLVLVFVDVSGVWTGFETGWKGYKLQDGYFPFGVNGMLGGAATLFASYVGFDALASTAEEVKNPQRDLPLGIGIAFFICASLYMSVSAVVVGIVPYSELNIDTPVSSAFLENNMQWVSYVIAIGALVAMLNTLIGCFLPQPRILMTMARDGLLPPLFSVVHSVSSVPVNGTLVIGVLAMLMAMFLNVEQLTEMVSVGTLIAFTSAGVCILVVRYATPPFEPSCSTEEDPPLVDYLLLKDDETSSDHSVLSKLSILCVVLGSLVLSLFVTATILPWWFQWIAAAIGGLTFAAGSIVLMTTKQDESHFNFGNSGGFMCPLVPVLPIVSILINVYLLLNVGLQTWIRVSIWLGIGILVYIFYGSRRK